MDFRVNCDCGAEVVVSERSAGARVPCSCGREVRVPALHELRVSVGLPPYPLSPELEIEHMLGTDSFPRRDRCTHCGTETDDIVKVVVQFGGRTQERSVAEQVAFVLLFGWIGLLLARRGESTGYDKIFNLPLHVCPTCLPRLRWSSNVKKCLRNVDMYDRLLEKHPYALVKPGWNL